MVLEYTEYEIDHSFRSSASSSVNFYTTDTLMSKQNIFFDKYLGKFPLDSLNLSTSLTEQALRLVKKR